MQITRSSIETQKGPVQLHTGRADGLAYPSAVVGSDGSGLIKEAWIRSSFFTEEGAAECGWAPLRVPVDRSGRGRVPAWSCPENTAQYDRLEHKT